MQRSFEVEPLKDTTFGAVVTGLKLAEIDETTFAELYRTWLDYALLVFPGQYLSNAEQVAFAKRFGGLEFELAPISNVRADGAVRPEDNADDVIKVLKGNMGWHCDSTYMPVQAKGAVFTCHVAPDEGGETGWADMRAAYDALDPAMKQRIAPLSAHHSLRYSQGKVGLDGYKGYGMSETEAPLRPLVKTHAETQRRCLMVGRHAHAIPGPRGGRIRAPARRPRRLRLPAAAHLPPSLGARRRRRLGQSRADAPRVPMGHDAAPRDVALPHRRRPGQRGLGRFGGVTDCAAARRAQSAATNSYTCWPQLTVRVCLPWVAPTTNSNHPRICGSIGAIMTAPLSSRREATSLVKACARTRTAPLLEFIRESAAKLEVPWVSSPR